MCRYLVAELFRGLCSDGGRLLLRPATCPDPVFVVGAPRSGTSVLAWALAQHSGFWASAESDFVAHLFGNGRAELAFDAARAAPNSWLALQGVELPEFLEYLGYGVNALLASRSGGRRWIDKSPTYALMMDLLGMMFPGARFLHIVRDGPTAVRSMLNSGFREAWAVDFVQACRTWGACVEGALEFQAAFPSRCVTIRHEDLTSAPEAVFSILFDFLGVQPEPGPVRFVRENRINSSFPHRYPDELGPGAQRDVWSQWSTVEHRAFLAEAAGALEKSRLVNGVLPGRAELSDA